MSPRYRSLSTLVPRGENSCVTAGKKRWAIHSHFDRATRAIVNPRWPRH